MDAISSANVNTNASVLALRLAAAKEQAIASLVAQVRANFDAVNPAPSPGTSGAGQMVDIVV